MAIRTYRAATWTLAIACLLLAAPLVQGQTLPVPDRYTAAKAAKESGDYMGCLEQLKGAGKTERYRWLCVECLYSGFKQAPDDRQLAIELLMACSEFIREYDDSKKIATANRFHTEVKAHFGHERLGFQRLRHDELPSEQRAALVELEDLLDHYSDADRLDAEKDREIDQQLALLAEIDLPMPSGESVFTYCLKRDGKHPLRALLGHVREPIRLLLLEEAVRYDAARITDLLLNGHISTLDEVMEKTLLQLAASHQANRVMHQWFLAQNDHSLVGLKTWRNQAPAHAPAMANAAIQVNDTSFMRYALEQGVPPDSLGHMVFRTMDAHNWEMLGVLLSASPPDNAKSTGGMSYLHKAFAMDSPDALKSLFHHGWLNRLSGEVDDQGTPAAHYLATMDLPRILAEPDLLAHVNKNATDRNGFTLLHKLVFRSPELSLSAESILRTLLESTPDPKLLSKNPEGPYHDWTPLHYAAREDRSNLVKLLVDKGADRHKKDAWGRSPKDVAKEYGFRKVIKAM